MSFFNTKAYMKAIRDLPEEWVDNDTRLTQIPNGNHVCANPKFAPMIHKGDYWDEILFGENDRMTATEVFVRQTMMEAE